MLFRNTQKIKTHGKSHTFYHPCSEGGIVSVVTICMFVHLYNNFGTVRDIMTQFSGHHPMVEKADKFENGYIRLSG